MSQPDWIGQRVIVDGRFVGAHTGMAWRRGVVIAVSNGWPLVRLERRGRERNRPQRTWPGEWLLRDTPDLRAQVADLVHGRDDA